MKTKSAKSEAAEKNQIIAKFLKDLAFAAKNFTWHRGRHGELRAHHKEHWGVFDPIGAVHFWRNRGEYIEPWNELLWETPEAKSLGSAAYELSVAADAPWRFDLGGRLLDAVGLDEQFCCGR